MTDERAQELVETAVRFARQTLLTDVEVTQHVMRALRHERDAVEKLTSQGLPRDGAEDLIATARRAGADASKAALTTEHLVPDTITICAACGYTAWRDGYPCNRCGGLEPRVYIPLDSADA